MNVGFQNNNQQFVSSNISDEDKKIITDIYDDISQMILEDDNSPIEEA